jgi:hypothetical protein
MVEGWWKGSSKNAQTNNITQPMHHLEDGSDTPTGFYLLSPSPNLSNPTFETRQTLERASEEVRTAAATWLDV